MTSKVFIKEPLDLKRFAVRSIRNDDYAKIFSFVDNVEPLRQYDAYIYKLFCDYFSNKSLMLEYEGNFVGLAIGFVLPNDPTSFFILQFGIAKEYRQFHVTAGFFRTFLLLFNECSKFYFTVKADSPYRAKLLKGIEYVTKCNCRLIDKIDFSFLNNGGCDFKYECFVPEDMSNNKSQVYMFSDK